MWVVIVMYKIVEHNALFIVVDKAPGVSVHNELADGSSRIGLFNRLKVDFGIDLWPVHRLDKMTSGLIVMAKSAELAAQFGTLFEHRQIDKYYLAIAAGKPTKKQGVISGDMAKSRSGSYKLLRSHNNPAKTRFVSHSLLPGYRAYLLKPFSGKTHQLRVALKSIATPILGDSRYGGKPADRGYLHAYALGFELQGQHYAYVSPPSQGEYFTLLSSQLATTQWLKPFELAWGG